MSVRELPRSEDDALGDQARRGIPLWFAGTCLVGALCQPDVQATMRPEPAVVESWSPMPGTAATVPEAVIALREAAGLAVDLPEASMGPVTTRPWEQTAALAGGDAGRSQGWQRPAMRLAAAAADAGGPWAERAVIPPTLPADGRLVSALAAPAQEALGKHISATWRSDERKANDYVERVFDVADDLELDPFLMLAIMAIESSFDPHARSGQGAQGLMQVHTRVHLDKFRPYGGASRATDPAINIRVGGQILKDYLERYGSSRAALKAYVGAARLNSDGGYSAKVMRQHDRFRDVVTSEFARLAADRFVSGVDRRLYDRIVAPRWVSASARP